MKSMDGINRLINASSRPQYIAVRSPCPHMKAQETETGDTGRTLLSFRTGLARGEFEMSRSPARRVDRISFTCRLNGRCRISFLISC
jgi:hypothetical protein